MPFIRCQNLKRDAAGAIVSGTASVVESYYEKGAKNPHRQRVVAKLGRPIMLDPTGRSGVFLMDGGRVVRYDSDSGAMSDVAEGDPVLTLLPKAAPLRPSVVMGDAFLLLSFLEEKGLFGCVRAAFPQKTSLKRAMAHIIHAVLRDGSGISCADFMAKSYASYVLGTPASMGSDSQFFRDAGEPSAKLAFFKAFASLCRERYPGFGKACYIDSTPLPNEIATLLTNAASSHGTGATETMSRMALVLDSGTGFPVWYDIIPGNLLDVSTLRGAISAPQDELGIAIMEFALDAGYVSADMVQAFAADPSRSYVARMPMRKGYPSMELYRKCRPLIRKGSGRFVRGGHSYFGKRQEIELFGAKVQAYCYVDVDNANKSFKERWSRDPDSFDAGKAPEREWWTLQGGWFVLISNRVMGEAEALDWYFSRIDVESYFKSSKQKAGLLPLGKWGDGCPEGKILICSIATVAILMVRSKLSESSQPASPSHVYARAQSLMCRLDSKGEKAIPECPNADVKAIYAAFGVALPGVVDISAESGSIINGPKPKAVPIGKKKRGRRRKIPIIK